jgi:hypothetical protein
MSPKLLNEVFRHVDNSLISVFAAQQILDGDLSRRFPFRINNIVGLFWSRTDSQARNVRRTDDPLLLARGPVSQPSLGPPGSVPGSGFFVMGTASRTPTCAPLY